MDHPDIQKMRAEISQVYGPNADSWIIKCQTMKPRQVVAIYLHMKEKGEFTQRRKKQRQKRYSKPQNYHQMTLWDYGIEL